jgi:hypothetical protein
MGVSLAKSPLGISSFSSLIGRGSGVFGSVVDSLLLVPTGWKDMLGVDEESQGGATRVNSSDNTRHE